MYEKLPKELKEKGLFCLWRYEERNSQKTKVPYSVNGKRADSTQKQCFSNLNAVTQAEFPHDGIGIGIFDGLCAVDIDHCVNNGSVSDMAKEIIDTLDSYTEISPSGTGIRIFFTADGVGYNKSEYYINNRDLGLEIYVCGYTNKFLTVTGNCIRDSAVCNRPQQLLTVLEKYMRKPTSKTKTTITAPGSYLSDNSVIQKALHSKQGEKFGALWNGTVPPGKSHSEADMALLTILAFWCGGDTEQMDRLFRSSSLYREKWERADYRNASLQKAVEGTTEFYKPVRKPTVEEDFNDLLLKLAEFHPEDASAYPWTDIGMGKLLADFYKDTLRYVPKRRAWFYYENGIWSMDVGNLKAMKCCMELANLLFSYALQIQDERVRKDYIDYMKRWQSYNNRAHLIKDAQVHHPISASEFDNDIYIFNCSNGTLHLDTGEFTEHRSEDRLSKISSVAYIPSAKCERWEKFISEITSGDTERAKFLQKIMGYALSGDTRHECMTVLYGATTRNGKGTLCESILKVFGNYGCTARPETISFKPAVNSSQPTEDIARLAGIRFVNISEPGKGLVLNAAQVKSMTGNDTVNARFLHENSFDFSPQFKIYINTNYLPVINDITVFTSNRIFIIPFERHFDEAEQDKGLKRYFATDEAQSAILNWLLEGYRQITKEGLTVPESVKKATEQYNHDSDKMQLFFEDNLIEEKNHELCTAAVYAVYKRWCADNGFFAESMKSFKQSLEAVTPVIRKRPKNGGEKTTLIIGYRLLDEAFL